MAKSQIIRMNILLFILISFTFAYLPIFNLSSTALFLMGVFWLYIFHNMNKFFQKKQNRFSFFWFMGKTFFFAETIENKIVRELAIILFPFSIIWVLTYIFKSGQSQWAFLIGASIFEFSYMVVLLVRPKDSSK